MTEIKVDRELCDGCGECLSVCPQDVYELDEEGKAFAARPEDCEEDCSCVEVCPPVAIWVNACE